MRRDKLLELLHRENVLITILGIALVLSVFDFTLAMVADSREMAGTGFLAGVIGSRAPIRNFFELMGFIATCAMPLVTLLALRLAREQSSLLIHQNAGAVQARSATIYSELLELWQKDEMVRSRRLIGGLAEFYDKHRADPAMQDIDGAPDYIKRVLLHFRQTNEQALRDHTAVIELLEYAGVLCRQNYGVKHDIYEFFAGNITLMMKRLKPYMLAVREEIHDRGLYDHHRAVFANALWLEHDVARFEPFQFPETAA